MQADTQTGEVLMKLDEIVRITFENGTSRVEEDGPLYFVYLKSADTILLKHNNFMYALQKDIPVFTNTRPSGCYYGKRYVLPYKGCVKAFVYENHVEPQVQKDVEFLFDSKIWAENRNFFQNESSHISLSEGLFDTFFISHHHFVLLFFAFGFLSLFRVR